MPFLFVINIYENKNRERNNMDRELLGKTKFKLGRINGGLKRKHLKRNSRRYEIKAKYHVKGMYEAIGLKVTKVERRIAS